MAFNRVRGDKIHKTVILDSSAILMIFEFSIDLENELAGLVGAYHLVVPTAVVRELQILATHSKTQKKAAAALKLIEKYETIYEDAQYADDALVQIAQRTKGFVVTNDAKVRMRLRTLGLPVIFLRGKKKLALEE